jgi:hypothetical protein
MTVSSHARAVRRSLRPARRSMKDAPTSKTEEERCTQRTAGRSRLIQCGR